MSVVGFTIVLRGVVTMLQPVNHQPADGDALTDLARAVRAQYAEATWFELARATSDAHHRAAEAHRRRDAAVAAAEDERFRVLQELLGDATDRCRREGGDRSSPPTRP